MALGKRQQAYARHVLFEKGIPPAQIPAVLSEISRPKPGRFYSLADMLWIDCKISSGEIVDLPFVELPTPARSEDTKRKLRIPVYLYNLACFTTSMRKPEKERAKDVYEWIHSNIPYDEDISSGRKKLAEKGYGEISPLDTLMNKEGICATMSDLYICMQRSVGISANYVHINVDYSGERVSHACAQINIGETFFSDIAYNRFRVDHKSFEIYSDEETIEHLTGVILQPTISRMGVEFDENRPEQIVKVFELSAGVLRIDPGNSTAQYWLERCKNAAAQMKS